MSIKVKLTPEAVSFLKNQCLDTDSSGEQFSYMDDYAFYRKSDWPEGEYEMIQPWKNHPHNKRIEKYQQHINDLQSGMYINCVYCGHRYGKQGEVPESMADILKQHVETCPAHPMSKLKKALETIMNNISAAYDWKYWYDHPDECTNNYRNDCAKKWRELAQLIGKQ